MGSEGGWVMREGWVVRERREMTLFNFTYFILLYNT